MNPIINNNYKAKAERLMTAVCDKVGQTILDVFKRWSLLGDVADWQVPKIRRESLDKQFPAIDGIGT